MVIKLGEDKDRLKKLIADGVRIVDEQSVYISADSIIGSGVTLQPNVSILGGSKIGRNCVIGANSVLDNATLGDNCSVKMSILEQCEVGNSTTVGPFAYLRKGAKIGSNCRVGDFVEVKNSTLGNETKASHLAYIGDAEVGEKVNIGCGAVFANYDGKVKRRSSVGNNVFIGANVNLVASVNIGDMAYIAAGSTVTENVPSRALCIARQRQVNKLNWQGR